MNIDEATERACEEPTLLKALSWICVWDCDRAVRQAAENQGGFETCFEVCIEAVMKAWGDEGAGARVAELEGLYAAACRRLQDLGETEVPLTLPAAEGAGVLDLTGLRPGDVVEVVRPLSTCHRVGSRTAVTHVSERGDFKLATGDATTPEMAYGFAYRPHVKVVGRRKTG